MALPDDLLDPIARASARDRLKSMVIDEGFHKICEVLSRSKGLERWCVAQALADCLATSLVDVAGKAAEAIRQVGSSGVDVLLIAAIRQRRTNLALWIKLGLELTSWLPKRSIDRLAQIVCKGGELPQELRPNARRLFTKLFNATDQQPFLRMRLLELWVAVLEGAEGDELAAFERAASSPEAIEVTAGCLARLPTRVALRLFLELSKGSQATSAFRNLFACRPTETLEVLFDTIEGDREPWVEEPLSGPESRPILESSLSPKIPLEWRGSLPGIFEELLLEWLSRGEVERALRTLKIVLRRNRREDFWVACLRLLAKHPDVLADLLWPILINPHILSSAIARQEAAGAIRSAFPFLSRERQAQVKQAVDSLEGEAFDRFISKSTSRNVEDKGPTVLGPADEARWESRHALASELEELEKLVQEVPEKPDLAPSIVSRLSEIHDRGLPFQGSALYTRAVEAVLSLPSLDSDTLGRIRAIVFDWAIRQSDDRDADRRIAAASCLAKLIAQTHKRGQTDIEAISALSILTSDESPFVRRVAAMYVQFLAADGNAARAWRVAERLANEESNPIVLNEFAAAFLLPYSLSEADRILELVRIIVSRGAELIDHSGPPVESAVSQEPVDPCISAGMELFNRLGTVLAAQALLKDLPGAWSEMEAAVSSGDRVKAAVGSGSVRSLREQHQLLASPHVGRLLELALGALDRPFIALHLEGLLLTRAEQFPDATLRFIEDVVSRRMEVFTAAFSYPLKALLDKCVGASPEFRSRLQACLDRILDTPERVIVAAEALDLQERSMIA
jgi:hypothetical protein